jgi:hypothetical protein
VKIMQKTEMQKCRKYFFCIINIFSAKNVNNFSAKNELNREYSALSEKQFSAKISNLTNKVME